MKYFILDNDWEYECLTEEKVPKEYDAISLDFGTPLNNLPTIDLIADTNKLPNSIPNHHLFLFFDNNIRNIIIKKGVDYLQYFGVNIYNKKNELISSDYKTINILNVIDAIDKEKSILELDEDGLISKIKNLSLNYTQINNALMFRLKGCETFVLIREDIAQEMVNNKLTGFHLFQAEGYKM